MTTHEEAVRKMNEINPNFSILSEFKGWRENIVRKCNICGDIRTVKARSIIEKNHGELRKCTVCAAIERAKKLKKTNAQFIDELHKTNPNIEPLEEYTATDAYMQFKCKIDGNVWKSRPKDVLQGRGCPECYRIRHNQRTNEEFIEEMKIKHPTIIPHGKFTRVNDIMKFECAVCGYEWETSPNSLLNDETYQCPKCANHYRIPEHEIIDRLERVNPYVKYIDGYTRIENHANFECLKCGHKWHTPMNSVLNGRGCPHCNMSHGELKIKDTLNNLHIEYESQYRFDDCKDDRALPFDFYIPSKNIAIEYDGEQHFMPVRFSKKQSHDDVKNAFENRQRLDKIKDTYCSHNNITLIRIPYTDFNNIEEIINKYIA